MDAALRDVSVEPRASLEAEIAGRFAAGERARRRVNSGRRGVVAAIFAVLTLAMVQDRGGPLVGVVEATSIIDHCCQDLDGGGVPDDGVLVESVQGTHVRRLVLYEDRDHVGRWSASGLVRFERRGAPTLRTSRVPGEFVTHTHCCVDYDGGGTADDGLLVVLSPTLEVLMVALYEPRVAREHIVLR